MLFNLLTYDLQPKSVIATMKVVANDFIDRSGVQPLPQLVDVDWRDVIPEYSAFKFLDLLQDALALLLTGFRREAEQGIIDLLV